MKQSILYFVAAALFIAAAVLGYRNDQEIGLGEALQLVAAFALAWAGLRARRSETR